ncbi:MAG: family 10 glycosylhydrolase [Prevotella sp.]|nr:family 10 glycosylhydrolase [Prevotella sp.]
MKRFLYIFFLICFLSAAAQPKYEVRAVWLTTLGGLDWPKSYAHDGMGIQRQQEDLCRILDQLQAINVNTVLFQTRVRATTAYPSELEPWEGSLSGVPGKTPGWDPLQFAIDECHRRGMELHAWVVAIPIGKWNTIGCKTMRKWYPSLVKRIGDEGYMNPEAYGTADYIANICEEITTRYDIDGIHLDYIRYPETWKGRKYHENITRIVRSVNHRVKRHKPWVKMSCSPIGKYGNLSRYRSGGWDAYNRVAQDAQGWLREGLMDQLYPMMYFSGNNFYPFAIDWQEQSYGRTIVSGLGTYMLHPYERNWPLSEVKRQLSVTRELGIGHCHFRTKFLLDNVKGVYDLMRQTDRHPALIPPMTWAQRIAPSAPTRLNVERTAGGDNLSWSGAQDCSNGSYLLYNIYASTEEPVDISRAENLIATRRTATTLSIRRKADKPMLHYAVTALDRYGNESQPIRSVDNSPAPVIVTALLPNDGKMLTVPLRNTFDADLLVVCDLKGRRVRNYINRPQINISQLPEGMYLLKSLDKKRRMHRLGIFSIKR